MEILVTVWFWFFFILVPISLIAAIATKDKDKSARYSRGAVENAAFATVFYALMSLL